MNQLKKFFYTYKKTFALAYRVSPKLLILIVVSNSIWGLTNLPVLYINKTLIDLVVNNIGNSNVIEPLKLIVLLALGRALLELVRSVFSGFNWSLSQSLIERIQAKLDLISSEKINNLDMQTVESSDFQDRYKKIEREANNRVWGMINPLSDFPNAIFTIISGLIPIFQFQPWIAFVVVIISIPDIFISTRIVKKDYEEGEILNPKWRVWGWIKWHLTDVKNLYENRILGGTNYLINKLSTLQNEILDFRYKRRINRSKLRLIGSLPEFILSTILNIYYFVLAILGKITLGSAQLLYNASSTLTNGFGMLINDGLSIYENYLFVSELTWLLDLETKENVNGTMPKERLTKGIEFKNVWFRYPNNKKSTLKGVSFTVEPNQNIALVGENGAGKTTLIKLLCGFYKPAKGEILFNGVNINEYNLHEYWKNLAVLFQDFSQYPFTAKESIGIGNSQKISDIKNIKNAAKLTDIDDFINNLSKGYDTPLTKEFESGVDPSKGQWQRIALARTIFRDANVLILDEPTSNVDPKAEEEIFDKIIDLSKNKVLFLISHRFSTVRKADKIVNLDNGVVTEQGSHDELLKKNGEYAKLFKLQAKGYQ
jgi:ABC-type multidrug transport system fused ATPase/permease subunit